MRWKISKNALIENLRDGVQVVSIRLWGEGIEQLVRWDCLALHGPPFVDPMASSMKGGCVQPATSPERIGFMREGVWCTVGHAAKAEDLPICLDGLREERKTLARKGKDAQTFADDRELDGNHSPSKRP
jgi:hypothetical protein